MKTENPLGVAPVGRLILRFAIPSMISMLVSAAYNITDQIFIGHMVGILGNAATNVAFPMVIMTTAFAQLMGAGTAANFNLSMGAKEEEEAKGIVGTGLIGMLILGILVCTSVLLFKTPILLLSGATSNVLPYAQQYLGITAFGMPCLLFTNVGSNLIRADGSPSYSMLCNVSGALLNIVLDWLFMIVFSWGIQGAAIATVMGQWVSFLLCLNYFPRFKSFRITRNILRIRLPYLKRILKLGTSNFINHTMMMVINIVLNNRLKYYGGLAEYGSDIPLAVAGVVSKLNSILTAFAVGLSQGCQPIWSYNMGAKNYQRVKAAYQKAAVAALGISMTAFVLFQTFPRQITSIFGTGNELYFQFAEKYLHTYMLMVCVFGIQPMTINYFTGIGKMKQGVFISLSRQGLFLFPLLILLPLKMGLNGVLYAGPIADTAAFLLSVTMVFSSFQQFGEESGGTTKR